MFPSRSLLGLSSVLVLAAVLAGCASVNLSTPSGVASPAPAPVPAPAPRPDDFLAAFSTQLTGMNEVPPTSGVGTGTLDAVLDKRSNLLRWRLSFTGLSGPATMAHFHGPAAIGANAGVALPFANPVRSPAEGRATLTPAQAADLLSGRWYVNVHTAANPGGEIRGQLIERR